MGATLGRLVVKGATTVAEVALLKAILDDEDVGPVGPVQVGWLVVMFVGLKHLRWLRNNNMKHA